MKICSRWCLNSLRRILKSALNMDGCNSKKLKRKWLLFIRWVFRFCGGYHQTEHAEIVWAAEVKAEKETAELRLNKLHLTDRLRMSNNMLREELNKKLKA